jgi:hypothetical protein
MLPGIILIAPLIASLLIGPGGRALSLAPWGSAAENVGVAVPGRWMRPTIFAGNFALIGRRLSTGVGGPRNPKRGVPGHSASMEPDECRCFD